jgi:hypothetical protein
VLIGVGLSNLTLKNGLYYCDICHDKNSIPKGTGFSFPPNPLNIEHAHQSCYNEYYNMGKSFVENNPDMAKRLKEQYGDKFG